MCREPLALVQWFNQLSKASACSDVYLLKLLTIVIVQSLDYIVQILHSLRLKLLGAQCKHEHKSDMILIELALVLFLPSSYTCILAHSVINNNRGGIQGIMVSPITCCYSELILITTLVLYVARLLWLPYWFLRGHAVITKDHTVFH